MEPDIKATYGFISRTIIDILANDDVDTDKIFIFSLYMQWGIILGHPAPLSQKEELIADILQWIATEKRPNAKIFGPEKLHSLFLAHQRILTEIYKGISETPVLPEFEWYKGWEEYCAVILGKDPSDWLSLLTILKESMKSEFENLHTSISLIRETLAQQISDTILGEGFLTG